MHLIGLMEFIGEVLNLAQFCNLVIGDILGRWDLGEIQNSNLSGMWGLPLMEFATLGGKVNCVERGSKQLAKGPTRKEEETIINRRLKAT